MMYEGSQQSRYKSRCKYRLFQDIKTLVALIVFAM